MKAFCALVFEDKSGNVFFPHGWVAYDEKTIREYEKAFKPDFPYQTKIGVQWFRKFPKCTEARCESGRALYIIAGPMLDAVLENPMPQKLIPKQKDGQLCLS